MGTNYYLHKESPSKCVTCNHDPHSQVLHIGKSSYGWCFSLHIIPEMGINSLEDWITEWGKPNTKILNEYDEEVLPEDMIKIITTRGPGRWCPEGMELHRSIGDHCVGHGSGSWDLIVGDFT